MAGGAAPPAGQADSILEAPTYILAIIFLVFAAISLSFEWCIRSLRRLLLRKGRPGLAESLDRIVAELTVLGFISVLLLVVQPSLIKRCVEVGDREAWTLLANAPGCNCCLASTAGVSVCAQIEHGCMFNSTTKAPYCGCNTQATQQQVTEQCQAYEDNEAQFVLENVVAGLEVYADALNLTAAQFCEELTRTWDDSAAPAPAYETQLWAQDVAADLGSAYAQRPGSAPQSAWPGSGSGRRRLHATTTVASEPVTMVDYGNGTSVHVLPQLVSFTCEGALLSGNCPKGYVPLISAVAITQVHFFIFMVAIVHVAVAVLAVMLAALRIRQWRAWQGHAGGGSFSKAPSRGPSERIGNGEESADAEAGEAGGGGGDGGGEKQPSASLTDSSLDAPPPGSAEGAAAGAAADRARSSGHLAQGLGRRWGRRDTMLRRRRAWVQESVIVVAQALWPNPISRQQFTIMREAFIRAHALPEDFDFVTAARSQLDHDMSRVVGLSLEMWIIWTLLVLLSGLAAWVAFLFIAVSWLVLFSTNLSLVALLRYACRGGRPNQLESAQRWWQQPSLFAIPIRMVIFLYSLVFSTAAFFAWQFGSESCLFGDVTMFQFLPLGLPWWLAMVVVGVLLVWTALVTIPAWTLVTHMRPATALTPAGKEAVRLASMRRGGSTVAAVEEKAHTGDELAGLQAEVARLKALLEAAGGPPA